MKHMKSFYSLFVYLLMAAPLAAFAQFDASAVGEGFDKQSREEIERANQAIEKDFGQAVAIESLSALQVDALLAKYPHLDPRREVPTDLLEAAVVFYDQNINKFPNRRFITIIDFKKRSDLQRFYVVNMQTGVVEKFRTAHGIGSDKNKDGLAEIFGNVVNSGKSSLGFIRTGEVYWGKFKRSVRLDGLQTSNSKLRERAVVLHGWDNVHERPVLQGLSWGCPALDWAVKDGVIDKVKEGSLMYMGVSK